MEYNTQVGSVGLRQEVVDQMVKQIAEPFYRFKQALTIVPTSAWSNVFFRENPAMTSGPAGNVFKGIPWGANFPHSETTWDEFSTKIIKHGVECNLPWEQLISGEIDVQTRTIIRRTREIAKSVDDDIYSVLTDNANLVTSFSVRSALHGSWEETSAAIIDDLLKASQLIAQQNYDVSDLICFVCPQGKRDIMTYLIGKGAQFPSIATDVAENGRIGNLAGITLVETNSITASYALIVKPKTCGTYRELVSLRSAVTEDPFKSWRVRIVEEGNCQVTDPLSYCLLRDVHIV